MPDKNGTCADIIILSLVVVKSKRWMYTIVHCFEYVPPGLYLNLAAWIAYLNTLFTMKIKSSIVSGVQR